MAFFSKFKIGSTSYDVKDALAGKTLSLSGTDLSLLKADGSAASTVTLPGAPYKLISYDATNSYFTFDGVKLTKNNCAVGDLIYFDASSITTPPISIASGGTNGLILYGRNTKYGGSTTSKRNLIQKVSSWFLARIAAVSASYVTAYIISCANTTIETSLTYVDRYGFVVSESTSTSLSGFKLYAPNGDEMTITESHYVRYDDGRFVYAISKPNETFSSGSFQPGPLNTAYFDYVIHVPSPGGNFQTYSYYYDATAGRYKTFANEGIGGGGNQLILVGHDIKMV